MADHFSTTWKDATNVTSLVVLGYELVMEQGNKITLSVHIFFNMKPTSIPSIDQFFFCFNSFLLTNIKPTKEYENTGAIGIT